MQYFRFFTTFRRPPVSTGSQLTPRSMPPDENGTITTMAKGVNDLLNYYIQVTDTKASIMIAGSVTAASFLLMTFPKHWGAQVMYLISASALGSALIMATMVVMPRLPNRTGMGSVFWGDIAMSSSASEYRDRFAKAAIAGLLDEEYSVLNFHTARILGSKIRILRGSIISFLAGVLLAVPHHLINS